MDRHSSTPRSLRGLVAGAIFALLGAFIVSAGPALGAATSDDPGPTISGSPAQASERMQRQEVMLAHLDPVFRGLTEAEVLDGFGSFVAADDMTSVTIYWKETPPSAIAKLQSVSDFKFYIKPARFSEGDRSSITQSLAASWKPEWGKFIGLQVSDDSSTLRPNWESAGSNISDGATEQDVIKEITQIAPQVTPERGRHRNEHAPIAWRWDDSYRWNTGIALRVIIDGLTDYCSSSFWIRTPNGDRMITAGHCGNQTPFRDGAGQSIGSTTWISPNHDFQMAKTETSGFAFIDSNEDTNPGNTRKVNDYGANVIGMEVCSGGANSGTHCGLKLIETDTDSGGWTFLIAQNPPALLE